MPEVIKNKIKKDVLLSPFSTFKIGGTADFFIEAKNRNELSSSITWAKDKRLNFFIIAGGSNILINDNGFRGLVIKYADNSIERDGDGLKCAAGAVLSKVVGQTLKWNLSGMEWAARIPGTVGGAIRGNAGAFGREMKDVASSVGVFDVAKNKTFILRNRECRFNYRDSIFKHQTNLIILSAKLDLARGDKDNVKKLIQQYSQHRLKSLPKEPSAGCVFKNIKVEDLERNNQTLAEEAKRTVQIWNGEIGAGWFIDKLGLKGKRIGGAKISEQHANFIINIEKASAEDVIMLISLVKQKARTKFKIQLQEEIQYVGF